VELSAIKAVEQALAPPCPACDKGKLHRTGTAWCCDRCGYDTLAPNCSARAESYRLALQQVRSYRL